MTLRQIEAATDAAARLELDERRARVLDARAAQSAASDATAYLEKLKYKPER